MASLYPFKIANIILRYPIRYHKLRKFRKAPRRRDMDAGETLYHRNSSYLTKKKMFITARAGIR